MCVYWGFNPAVSCIQLDWPWIAEWTYVGIFAVAVRFQNQNQFWVSHQKNQGSFSFIFSKSQRMSSTAKNGVFGGFSKRLIVFW